jgi:hypothetical protein
MIGDELIGQRRSINHFEEMRVIVANDNDKDRFDWIFRRRIRKSPFSFERTGAIGSEHLCGDQRNDHIKPTVGRVINNDSLSRVKLRELNASITTLCQGFHTQAHV